MRNRGCNFSTLIYLWGFALCLIANRIFAPQANSVGKYERDANSMPYAQKGLRVFPLSETAIADITVTGILVGTQSWKHTFALYVYECLYRSAIYEL